MNLSDDENSKGQREQIKKKNAAKRVKRGGAGAATATKYQAEVDANVFEISLACLKRGAELATGDPVKCISCQAVFNKESPLTKNFADDDEE